MRRLGVAVTVFVCTFAVPATALATPSDTDERGAAAPRSAQAPYRGAVPARYATYALQHLEPSFWTDNPKIRFHSDGSVWFNYGSRYGAGWRFNPVTTAQWCLANYNRWAAETSDARSRRAVVRAANGLLRRAEPIGDGIGWRYAFPQSSFGAQPGWISGMAQGQAMGCLAGALRVTRDRRYAREAARAHRVLVAPFGADGTAVPLGRGVFYEEVAGDGVRPAHILNGHLFALAGIALAHANDPRPIYAASLRRGIAATRSVVTRYFAGATSLYDLGPRRLALPGEYNLVHAMGLRWLADRTGDPWLHAAAMRFQSYERVVRATATMTQRGRTRRIDVGGRAVVTGSGTARIDLTLPASVRIDRVFLAARDGASAPASVRVQVGDAVTSARGARFLLVRTPARSVRTVAIWVTAREGRSFALRYIALNGPAARSLTITSNDLSALYPVAGPQIRALRYLTDGNPSTVFRSGLPATRITVEIGPARFARLRIRTCSDGRRPASFAFGTVGRFGAPVAFPAGDVVELDVRGRALALVWDRTTSGCLAELTGLDPRVPV